MDVAKIKEERKQKDSFFKTHPQSPISYEEKDKFAGLNYFPVNPKFRFMLELHEHKNKKR